MADDVKVTEAPGEVKASGGESLIDNPRAAIENAIENDSAQFEPPATEAEVPAKEVAEVKSDEGDPVEKIKQATQKRINQLTAQKKSVEEEVAELRAEVARLKTTPPHAVEPVSEKRDNAAPTVEQVEAYIIKMKQEGNAEEEVKAMRYLIQMEKDAAIKAVKDEEAKVRQEAESRAQRENQALIDLAKDYVVLDEQGQAVMDSDLTLANQKGLLFRTAMSLYNDPELRRDLYSDADRPQALRRAVADAYREIHQRNLVQTPKVEKIEAPKRARVQLADPDSVEAEDNTQQSNSHLSDAEKVREEIKARNQMRNKRRVP